jgi:hypothetical protein
MKPLTFVVFSSITLYSSFGAADMGSTDSVPAREESSRSLRTSKNSGVSSPPGTVETMDWVPEGVSRPSAGGWEEEEEGKRSSAASESASDSSSSSSSSK